jgi:hypothetical protein
MCVGYIERISVGNAERSSIFFTHCNARVSALVIMLPDSPCEGIGKLETCPILKEDIWLVPV